MKQVIILYLWLFTFSLFSIEGPRLYRNRNISIVSFGKKRYRQFSPIEEDASKFPTHCLAGKIALDYFKKHKEHVKLFAKCPLSISGNFLQYMKFEAQRMEDRKAVKIIMH